MTGGFEKFDFATLTTLERYKFLTGSIIPRPIAFVTTLNEDGTVNAAPFSEFVIVATSPGILGFSCGTGISGTKDTVVNIRRTGEFVINTVPEHLAIPVQECAEELPRNVSEIDKVNLKLLPSEKISVPRVAESRIQFECTVNTILEFGSKPNSFVIGDIRLVHAQAGLVRDSKIDPREYKPLGRIGGRRYVKLGEFIDV